MTRQLWVSFYESVRELTEVPLPGSKRCAQLFLFLLTIFLKPTHVRHQLFLKRFYVIEFSTGGGFRNLVGQKNFPFRNLRVERGIDLRQFCLLLGGQCYSRRAFLQPFHCQLVSGLHYRNRCSLRWRNQFLS